MEEKKWQEELPKSIYPFKGWDWSELAACWGIDEIDESELDPKEPFSDDKILATRIKDKIWGSVFFDEVRDPQVLADTYAFLKRVVEIDNHGDTPAIAGILEIKHPWSFAKWVCNNLEFFWT